VGCGLATYFWSWPKNTKQEGDLARREGGKLEEREGREGNGKDQPKKQRLGSDQTPEGHRKQQSESNVAESAGPRVPDQHQRNRIGCQAPCG